MTEDMDARARVKRLEAECERLRDDMQAISEEGRSLRQGGPDADDAQDLHDALESAVGIAYVAMQRRGTPPPPPPPEGEPEEPMVHIWSGEHGAWWRPNSAGYTPSKHEAGAYPMSQAQDILAGVGDEKGLEIVTVADAPHTPEQTGKCLDCLGTGRKCMSGESAHPSNWYECPSCGGAGKDPDQAEDYETALDEIGDFFVRFNRNDHHEKTGDALAALDRLERLAMSHHHNRRREHIQQDAKAVRRHLTASGVPYVPEEVRRLPDKWDSEVDGPEVESHWRDAVGGCIDDLKDALASAPAVPRIPVEVAKRVIAVRDAMIEGDDMEAWHQLYRIADPDCTQSKPWAELERIAAAPTDGSE